MSDQPKSTNITWQQGNIRLDRRESLLHQRGCIIWLTGLSGSGKSTLAYALEQYLIENNHLTYVLDGDNVRHGLNCDLGFSQEDRNENIRRVGEVAALFADAGLITIAAYISPYRQGRQRARNTVPAGRFIEILLDTPIEVCEKRDPKGLYKKARAGEIDNFTGIDAPYEKPEHPELIINTADLTIEASLKTIVTTLVNMALLGSTSNTSSKPASNIVSI